jgi:hypothetical protein
MRKTKKFLAAILSAATVFSMSAIPAFAAADASSDDAFTLEIKKVFESENNGALPDADFKFTMEPVDVASGTTYSGLDVEKGLALDEDETTIGFEATTDSSESDTDEFVLTPADNKEFEGPKAYAYVVKEDASYVTDTSITCDPKEYTVYVLVDNDNNVTAVVNVSVKDGEGKTTAIGKLAKEGDGKSPIVFTNTCKTDSLTIVKKVEGALGDKDEVFKFKIDIPVAGSSTGHTITAGTTFTGKYTRAKSGTMATTADIVVGADDNIIELKDGDSFTIEGLPQATIYTITEQDATDYHTDIEGKFSTENSSGNTQTVTAKVSYDATNPEASKVYSATAKNTPIVDGGNTITYTNTKNVTVTGLAVAFGPQLLVLMLAVGGALVIFKTRRKAER